MSVRKVIRLCVVVYLLPKVNCSHKGSLFGTQRSKVSESRFSYKI